MHLGGQAVAFVPKEIFGKVRRSAQVQTRVALWLANVFFVAVDGGVGGVGGWVDVAVDVVSALVANVFPWFTVDDIAAVAVVVVVAVAVAVAVDVAAVNVALWFP